MDQPPYLTMNGTTYVNDDNVTVSILVYEDEAYLFDLDPQTIVFSPPTLKGSHVDECQDPTI